MNTKHDKSTKANWRRTADLYKTKAYPINKHDHGEIGYDTLQRLLTTVEGKQKRKKGWSLPSYWPLALILALLIVALLMRLP
jgi:hypothetical protein